MTNLVKERVTTVFKYFILLEFFLTSFRIFKPSFIHIVIDFIYLEDFSDKKFQIQKIAKEE